MSHQIIIYLVVAVGLIPFGALTIWGTIRPLSLKAILQ